MEELSNKDLHNERIKAEISAIDERLKSWFINRRFLMERNIALRKMLDRHNVMGLSMNNMETPKPERVMWHDIVYGKPELEDSLSLSAREMKSDRYMKTFKTATDLDHVCRIPGVTYFRCLHDNFKKTKVEREIACGQSFNSFDSCRKGIVMQQDTAIRNGLMRQHKDDIEAKELFELRVALMDTVTGGSRVVKP
eukprot:GHVN01050528.1.p1 GENE.GHVN01050528.1~~GHVN01050528.1.p1  ORF type:complete len:195 (+),score=22.52 GHVN01050528.1:105-689(+)